MTEKPSHIPPGLPAVVAQFVVKDAPALIEFAVQAFEANRGHVMPGPDGKGIMHGMFFVGGVPIFVSDTGGFAPPTSANLFVYLPDVDRAFARALEAGAKPLAPVGDMFWGDRWGMVSDPWGNVWQIATHKEDVGADEMMKRMQAQMTKAPG